MPPRQGGQEGSLELLVQSAWSPWPRIQGWTWSPATRGPKLLRAPGPHSPEEGEGRRPTPGAQASRPGRKGWPEPGQRADVQPAMCTLIRTCTRRRGASEETLLSAAFLLPSHRLDHQARPGQGRGPPGLSARTVTQVEWGRGHPATALAGSQHQASDGSAWTQRPELCSQWEGRSQAWDWGPLGPCP